MDVNALRMVVMIAGFLLFIALMVYTWSNSRRHEYEEAALLPFRSDVDTEAGRTEPRGERA